MSRDYAALRESDRRDAEAMAYAISTPLHNTTDVPWCERPTECPLCSNAARLAVQHYRPIIERRIIESLTRAYGAGCAMPHPGDD